ncbi:Unknown protein sequence [Pseudomonas amygdali pv. lachrymans]|nr:Unknown protein sequence [Pseudomonas amygdali pv. lachrymans]
MPNTLRGVVRALFHSHVEKHHERHYIAKGLKPPESRCFEYWAH